MKDSSPAVHDALISFLRAHGDVAPLVTGSEADARPRIYDRPPQGVKFPYIALGMTRVTRFRLPGLDGCAVTCEFYCFSRATSGGKHEAETVKAAVAGALDDAKFDVEGHTLVGAFVEGTTVTREQDGLTIKGIVTARFDTVERTSG